MACTAKSCGGDCASSAPKGQKAAPADNLAQRFYEEVLEATESVCGIAEQYGQMTLVDIFHLLGVLTEGDRHKSFIDEYCGSRVIEFVDTLPSAAAYRPYIRRCGCKGDCDDNPRYPSRVPQ